MKYPGLAVLREEEWADAAHEFYKVAREELEAYRARGHRAPTRLERPTLLRHGATLTEAHKLARHSDVGVTMRYTHIGLDDQAKALAALPTPAAGGLHIGSISHGAGCRRLTVRGPRRGNPTNAKALPGRDLWRWDTRVIVP